MMKRRFGSVPSLEEEKEFFFCFEEDNNESVSVNNQNHFCTIESKRA